jgi:histidine triad (HIT) family protein
MILPYNSYMTELNMNCIFCKLINKEILCNKIYEDKSFLVFLDIKPVNHGHLLIIPKKHFIWMQEADDKTITEIFRLAKKMMLVLKKGLKCDYVQLLVVGNEVPHFHIHLIPRYKSDNFRDFPTKKYKSEEDKKIMTQIKNAL